MEERRVQKRQDWPFMLPILYILVQGKKIPDLSLKEVVVQIHDASLCAALVEWRVEVILAVGYM